MEYLRLQSTTSETALLSAHMDEPKPWLLIEKHAAHTVPRVWGRSLQQKDALEQINFEIAQS